MSDTTFSVLINHVPHHVAPGATLADAVALVGIQPPFAAAVNLQFVPRSQYKQHLLAPEDKIELIAPITGG
jgi:sulfur carrier protein